MKNQPGNFFSVTLGSESFWSHRRPFWQKLRPVSVLARSRDVRDGFFDFPKTVRKLAGEFEVVSHQWQCHLQFDTSMVDEYDSNTAGGTDCRHFKCHGLVVVEGWKVKSRKLAFRLELELSFRNSTGGLGVAWAQVATRGPVFGLRACFWTPFPFRGPVLDPLYLPEACFWSLFFCACLFLDTPCLPQTCFWNPFVLCRHVFGIPVSSAGLFLDSFVFRGHVFTCPLSSAGVSLDCLYFVFHHGFVFGSLLWAPWWSVLGLHFGAGGPFWGSVLVPVVRLGVSV